MERPKINLPTPMTPEARRAIQGVCIDSRLSAYGPNDWGTAGWHKGKYPGFTDEQYAIFEIYSNGITPKQYRNMLEKLPQNERRCRNVSHRQAQLVQPQPARDLVRHADPQAGCPPFPMHAILPYHHGQRRDREDVHASQLVDVAASLLFTPYIASSRRIVWRV